MAKRQMHSALDVRCPNAPQGDMGKKADFGVKGSWRCPDEPQGNMGEKGPESKPSSGLALGRSSDCSRLISLMMTAFSSLNCSSSAHTRQA